MGCGAGDRRQQQHHAHEREQRGDLVGRLLHRGVIDFDAEDARSKVADAITLERLAARDAGTLPEGMALTPLVKSSSTVTFV